jgi:hypothetical protein
MQAGTTLTDDVHGGRVIIVDRLVMRGALHDDALVRVELHRLHALGQHASLIGIHLLR